MLRSGAETVVAVFLTLCIVVMVLGAVIFYRYGQFIILGGIAYLVFKFTTHEQRTKAVESTRNKIVKFRGKDSP